MAKLVLATLLLLFIEFQALLISSSFACNCTYPPKHPPKPKPPPHAKPPKGPKHPPRPKPPPHVQPPLPPRPPVVRPPIVRPPVPCPPTPTPPLPPSPPAPPVTPVPAPPITPVPAPPAVCPIDTLKLNACVDLLGGLIHIGIGQPTKATCCPLIQGLAGLDAALCLCTALRVKLLNLNIFLPIALQLLVTCGLTPPPGFQCPPLSK